MIPRQRRYPAAENPGKPWAGLVPLIRRERVAGDTGAKHFRTMIAGISGERIFRRTDDDGVNRFAA